MEINIYTALILVKPRLRDTVKGNEFQRCMITRRILFWYSNQLKIGATQETINLIMTWKEDKLVPLNSFPRYGGLQLWSNVLNNRN